MTLKKKFEIYISMSANRFRREWFYIMYKQQNSPKVFNPLEPDMETDGWMNEDNHCSSERRKVIRFDGSIYGRAFLVWWIYNQKSNRSHSCGKWINVKLKLWQMLIVLLLLRLCALQIECVRWRRFTAFLDAWEWWWWCMSRCYVFVPKMRCTSI